MRETLKRFLQNTAAAVENGTKAEQALVDRFKAMTPEEFARVPRDLLDRLSDAQYREVVGRIAPDQDLPHPEPAERPQRQRRSFRDRWLAVWLPLRAVLLGGGCGLAILVFGLAMLPAFDWWQSLTPPIRPAVVSTWPACGRLNQWVDGCLYRTTVERSWDDVARQLDLPETYLRTLNKHVRNVRLPAKTLLIVWRERGTLRGSN